MPDTLPRPSETLWARSLPVQTLVWSWLVCVPGCPAALGDTEAPPALCPAEPLALLWVFIKAACMNWHEQGTFSSHCHPESSQVPLSVLLGVWKWSWIKGMFFVGGCGGFVSFSWYSKFRLASSSHPGYSWTLMVLFMLFCESGKCLGGYKLLKARRGHAPFLAALSVGCNSLGKCSTDYSLPGDALPLAVAGDGRRCLWEWLGLFPGVTWTAWPPSLLPWDSGKHDWAAVPGSSDVRSQLSPGWDGSVHCHLCLVHLSCQKCFTFACYIFETEENSACLAPCQRIVTPETPFYFGLLTTFLKHCDILC